MNRRHLLALVAVAGLAAVPGLAQAEESFGTEQGHDLQVGESDLGMTGHDDRGGEHRQDEAGQEHNLGLDD